MTSLLPNLIIPGGQKCGSTSLASYFGAHPDCRLSSPKETTFFSKASNLAEMDRYPAYFGDAGDTPPKVIAEATTEYMPSLRAPDYLSAFLGKDLKFIFILRSPLARSYSGYLHNYKRGREKRKPEAVFQELPAGREAVMAEELRRIGHAWSAERISPEPHKIRYDDYLWQFRYMANSFYREQIARYEAMFDPKNILVLVFEEALKDTEGLRRKMSAFLDVDPAGFPDALPHDNRTRLPDKSLRTKVSRMIRGHTIAGPVALKPEPHIVEALQPIFADEVGYWSKRLDTDLTDFGW